MICAVAYFNHKKVRVRYLVWFIFWMVLSFGGKKSLQGELKAFFRFSPGNDLLSHILD